MEHKDQHEQAHDKVETSIGSMLFSILLVALAMGFVFGFKYYLSGRTYHGPKITGYLDEESAEEGSADEIVMDVDHSFHNEYVMVQDLRDKELWASPKPVKKEDKAGKPDKKAIQVKEGDILKVKERGTFEGERYYLLDNGLYLADTRAIIPLKEYVEMEGYLSITYINASGVHLRKWADFDADNVVDSVYVGDKVNVTGKVVTVNDVEAYVTEDGYYITTDSRYLNEHTTVVGGEVSDEESSSETTADEKSSAGDTADENLSSEETADEKLSTEDMTQEKAKEERADGKKN